MKFLFLSLTTCMLCACQETNLEKAQATVAKNIKSSLEDGSKYQAEYFGKIDSTFTEIEGKREFNGYKIDHRFRTRNSDMVFEPYEQIFFLNKDLTEITHAEETEIRVKEQNHS